VNNRARLKPCLAAGTFSITARIDRRAVQYVCFRNDLPPSAIDDVQADAIGQN